MTTRLTFIHALSPLHAGVGQGSGVIDLPVAREKATGIPFLPGSSLKGALRTQSTYKSESYTDKIFGPSDLQPENEARASLIQISDQRLLFLPVRSLVGTFAWITSPYVLQRLLRDIDDVRDSKQQVTIPEPRQERCLIADTGSVIELKRGKALTPTVYLEDLDLQADSSGDVTHWAKWLAPLIFGANSYWNALLPQRLCLVHDDIFNFLLKTATEITARIRLEEQSKVVTSGGLWYEEALPTESILSGIALATLNRHSNMKASEIFTVLDTLTNKPLQLGGKATVGRGMCNVRLSDGEK